MLRFINPYMLTYEKALCRLLSPGSVPKLGLERMQTLLQKLGNPEASLSVLHVAGTNGKGSVCAYLENTLRQAGYSTGLYTSPHLQSARERIQLNGQLISEGLFVELENQVHHACQDLGDSYSFFERVTAMAFLAFSKANVDYAVIEVGLGGRLDATNCVSGTVCGITSIDFDHMDFLGNTLGQIAYEKAGIIKDKVPVVTMQLHPEAQEAIAEVACLKQAPLIEAEPVIGLMPSLAGTHQQKNAAIAWHMLDAAGLVKDVSIRQKAFASTKWPCRYEYVSQNPDVLIDGAHNPAAIIKLIETVKNDIRLQGRPMVAVVGFTKGHDPGQFAAAWQSTGLWPHMIVATRFRAPRSQEPSSTKDVFKADACMLNVQDACRWAIEKAKSINGYVLITGSLYLAGEARGFFIPMAQDSHLPLY